MSVTGVTEPGYEQLRGIFERLVDDGRESGAAVSVWADGREVVSLCGGWTDVQRTKPWQSDTLVHTYSTSKPFAALCALTMVASGTLDLDAPVGDVWPEFQANGKGGVTVRQLLTHRAGLPGFPASARSMDPLDAEGLIAALASAAPELSPGTQLAEHALTYGHLIDGLLRAVTGRSLGEVYAEDVRPVLGIDAWFGVPERDLERVADVEHALPGGADQFVAEVCPTYEGLLSIPRGVLEPETLNSRGWRRGVFGAINLHASARALAAFYGAITDGGGPVGKLLGPELHEEYLRPQICGFDRTVGKSVQWTLGPLRTDAFIGLGGLGGSAAYWSLLHGHAVAYVTRRLHDHSRVAEFAVALEDNLNMEVDCD